VKIVQRPLRDAVLYFDRTLDVLLLRELHLVVDVVGIIPLGGC
jgi:hypothetical protein